MSIGVPVYDTPLKNWALTYIYNNFDGYQEWIDKNAPVTLSFDTANKVRLAGQRGSWGASITKKILQARRDAEWYYQHDPKYKAVMDIAMRLCEEYDYDWGEFISRPEYARFANDKRVLHYQETLKLDRSPKYGVCEAYANAAVENFANFANLPFVKEVKKWHAPGHAFNELVFDDGRHLWVDVTWMDNDGDYSKGKYDTENITFNLDIFESLPAIDGSLSHKERDSFISTYNPAFYNVRWYIFDVNNGREVTLNQMYKDRGWARASWFDNHEREYIDFQGYRYEWRSVVTPVK
jgi:hypothetical protein